MTGLSAPLRRTFCFLTVVAMLLGCTGQTASQQPDPPTSTSPAADATAQHMPTELGLTADTESVQFTVSLRLPGAADLDAYLHDLITPGSSNYQQYLAPEEFGARFGLSDTRITPIVAWLEGGGLAAQLMRSEERRVGRECGHR